jgi:hypothetical protein
MWTCVDCGETSDEAAVACWNCGTSREGARDPTFRRADDPQFNEAEWVEPPLAAVCPCCHSAHLSPEPAGPSWGWILMILFFPFSLVLFPLLFHSVFHLDRKLWCGDCGACFKIAAKHSYPLRA